jgi:hypothetical protein
MDQVSNVPIDLVYTWVDGSKFSHILGRTFRKLGQSLTSDNTWTRWADRGDLKYSLRSMAKNSNFFRKIFIVCADGQRPSWIRCNDQIEIIQHSAIIPAQYLPNYCSSTIESFIHRIPGLSEQFVYSNDDFMFWSPVDQEFFLDGRRPKIYLDEEVISNEPPTNSDNGHESGKKNGNIMLNSRFGISQRRNVYHFPVPLTKSACAKAWEWFPEQLDLAAQVRFRSHSSVAFTNHLIPHLMLHDGSAVARSSQGLGMQLSYRSYRITNLLAAVVRYKGEVPEIRAKKRLAVHPEPRFINVDGDEITIQKIMESRFAKSGPHEND